jgi:hypothetical protein
MRDASNLNDLVTFATLCVYFHHRTGGTTPFCGYRYEVWIAITDGGWVMLKLQLKP